MVQLNGWRIMWIMIAFDLPTGSKQQRRSYTQFRKRIFKEGFVRLQYSIYARHFQTQAHAGTVADRLGRHLPANGVVSFFFITDKQFGMTRNFFGNNRVNDNKQKKLGQFLIF